MKLTVVSGRKVHEFNGEFRLSKNDDQLLLGVDFYQSFGRLPSGDHYEIEVLQPKDEPLLKKLHTRKSPTTGTYFVCYPHPISSTSEATTIFRVWCLGSVLTLDHGIDLTTVLDDECRGEFEKFFKLIKDRYSIFLKQEEGAD